MKELGHAPSLTLALEESEDVLLPDGSLDVTNDGAGGVVHELDTDLGDTTTGTSPSENLPNVQNLATTSFSGEIARTLMTLASLTGAFDESYETVNTRLYSSEA
jgi:hypothetical protein